MNLSKRLGLHNYTLNRYNSRSYLLYTQRLNGYNGRTYLTQARVITAVMMMQMINTTNAPTMTPIITTKHNIIAI